MSAKVFSRDYAPVKVKQLQPRNPVVYAMVHRGASAGAGKHIRDQGALRRAEKVTLQKLARQLES
nr:hypothetical protein [Rhodoferax sp.]